MQSKRYFSQAVLLSTLLFPFSVFAFSADDLKNVEVSAAVGPSFYRASNGYIQSSTIETDLDQVLHVTKSTDYRFGVGYHFFSNQLATRSFFNDLLVELNWYHSSASITGLVWDAGLEEMQNQTFRAPFTSDRLMLDVKPTLFTSHHVSFYPILGIGVAHNKIAYREVSLQQDWPAAILPSATNKNMAYDLGYGFRAEISKNLNASIEYVATHLGRMTPSSNSDSTQGIVSAPSFPIRNQSLLLGLSWKF